MVDINSSLVAINSSLVAINSSLQHYDPCWLPSAIMQTTAALLGLYAVVYVLMIERVWEFERERVWEFERAIPRFTLLKTSTHFDLLFIIVLSFSIFTIFFNACWLATLSEDGSFFPVFPYIDSLAVGSFVSTLTGIFFYTLIMILFRRKIIAFERREKFKRIKTDAEEDFLKDPEGEIKD